MTDLLTDNVRDPGPGVHVVVHDDPLAAGRVIAERIGARLVDTPVEAEAAVHHRLRLPELRSQRERLDQIEMLAWGLPEAEDESFLARERELERVARRRAIDITTVERIAALTRELESLEQVRTGTERRVREEMIDALGATMPHTVVLHPTSLRTAAARVRAAEEALADARLALDLVPVAVPSLPGSRPATRRPPRRRPHRARGRSSPSWPRSWWASSGALRASVRASRCPPPSRRRSSVCSSPCCSPAAAAAPAPSTSGCRRPPRRRTCRARTGRGSAARRPDAQAHRDRPHHRGAARGGRAADWGVVAGFDADPEDIDAVIRQRDPQFDLTADLVDASPSAPRRRSRAPAGPGRLAVAVGVPRAAAPRRPTSRSSPRSCRTSGTSWALPAEAADALRRTETRADRARRRLALEAALGDEDLSELRRSTPPRHDLDDRSLVLVSPFFPLAEQRRFQLRAELEALPDDMTVVIVVTHESEVPPRIEVGQG